MSEGGIGLPKHHVVRVTIKEKYRNQSEYRIVFFAFVAVNDQLVTYEGDGDAEGSIIRQMHEAGVPASDDVSFFWVKLDKPDLKPMWHRQKLRDWYKRCKIKPYWQPKEKKDG